MRYDIYMLNEEHHEYSENSKIKKQTLYVDYSYLL